MAVTTKIIVQQILNIDDTKATASKFPRYTVTLGNSISSITASELVSSIEAAAKSAAAAKDSEIAAKTSELNAKNSEQEAAISAGASEASATQSATSATQSAASADRSAESAAAAKVSETNAKASETKAKTSETNAKASETNAKSSETKAKTSETNAKTSETNAAASAAAAKISETNAKISETNAAESAASAADSKGFRDEAEAFAAQAAASAAAAKVSETKAKTSETNAKSSETKAKASETNAASSATSASQSVTTIQGLKSDVEILKSDTQTIKNSAVTETTVLKDQAATSAANAAASATEAGKQATNAANSANSAKTEADRSKTEADRAKTEADRSEAAINDTPELQPLPDVWIPFNDSLEMITGFAPGYKKITVGDDVITMPTDKVVTFSRASTATYINKSGVLTVAEIDEPRFEKEGLLIEGQRTNYLRNSNKTDSWTIHSSLNKTFGIDDRGFNYATVTPTESIVGATGGYTVHGVVTADRFPLVSGESFTFSCRVKGAKARCRLRVSTIIDGTDTFSADSYLDLDTLVASVSGDTTLITAKAEQDGEWTYYQATYTANTDVDTINCAFYMTNKINNEPFYSDSTLTMTTPQIELGNTASSFIITSMPTTRASDLVSIPTRNNLYKPPFTFLLEVHKSWDIAPNAAPRVWDIAAANTGQSAIAAINRGSGKLYMSLSTPSGAYINSSASDVFAEKTTFGCIAKADGNFHVVTNGKAVNDTYCEYNGVTADKNIRFGGQTNTGERHLFGHIRNFRIWFKELTDRQMKESV